MFRHEYQKGFITIFSGAGSSPLKIWQAKAVDGCIERVVDPELNCLVMEITGSNVSTTYISCPKNKEDSLGITMPIFTLNWQRVDEFFAFEIVVKDKDNIHRRFRFSNFVNIPRIKSTFFAVCPIKNVSKDWHQLKFNLSDMTQKAFCKDYVETVRVQINANCRLKNAYFSDQLHEDKDIPNECRLVKMIQPRRVYTPFQKKRKQARKRMISSDSKEAVPWIREFREIEETQYDKQYPSEASSEIEEREIYTTEIKKSLIEVEEDDHEDGQSEMEDEESDVKYSTDDKTGSANDSEYKEVDEEEEEFLNGEVMIKDNF